MWSWSRAFSRVRFLARSRNLPSGVHAIGPSYSFSCYYNYNYNYYYNCCCYYNYYINSISSGVSEPQVAKNHYLPLTGGIALTTVYALMCYTVIHEQSLLQPITVSRYKWRVNSDKANLQVLRFDHNGRVHCFHMRLKSRQPLGLLL